MPRLRAEVAVSEVLEAAAETLAAAGCEAPTEDAEALIADALGLRPEQLSRHGGAALTAEVSGTIEARVQRRAAREPLAYILGRAAFRGIELAVDERVLIPRRETELLVEVAAELPEGARVHEVGTGSGAVALALLTERPDLRVTASDISPRAAVVARENAERLGIPLEVIVARGLPEAVGEVDLVLANLPYVTERTIYERSAEIRREPRLAVIGECGADGLGVIRSLVAEAPSGSRLALEHDTHHGPALREMLRGATTLHDQEGEERATVGYAP